MFVDHLAAAIDAARGGAALDLLSRQIWQGLEAKALGDDDAQRLAELIHAKRESGKAAAEAGGGYLGRLTLYPPRRSQRAPLRPAAIARRRRLASTGPLPPSIAARFTTGELAVLRIIGDECRDKDACLLTLAAIAARAGVCRKLVQTTIRLAKREGLLAVQERRRRGQVSLPNVVTVVSTEWRAWLKRGPRSQGIGGKIIAPTDTSLRSRRGIGHPPQTSKLQTGRESHSAQRIGFRLSRGSGEGSAR